MSAPTASSWEKEIPTLLRFDSATSGPVSVAGEKRLGVRDRFAIYRVKNGVTSRIVR